MRKVFTDAQIEHFTELGHPIADLMTLINGHTNSLAYADHNLHMLADMVSERRAKLDSDRSRMLQHKYQVQAKAL